MKVLLVDDDESVLTTLRIAIAQRGFAVTGTTDSEEALLLLRRERFDVLVTDGYMPNVNGFNLAGEAELMRPAMRKILITGFYEETPVVTSVFSKMFTKPVDVEALSEYLRDIEDELSGRPGIGQRNRVRSTLRQANVDFRERRHPTVVSAQELAKWERISGNRVAKVVAALTAAGPVLLVLPASRRVILERVREIAADPGAKLANEEDLRENFQDCEAGAIPPLRHWKGVEIWMDTSMRVSGDIVFEAGTHKESIELRFEDWLRLTKPRVEAFTEGMDQPPCIYLPGLGG